jgi:small basic protein
MEAPMEAPSVALSVWILAALDPVLIALAAYLGWKADQFAKLFIAAMAALIVAVLVAWAITAIGLPWMAPVGQDYPLLLQVRTLAAFAWACAGYFARRLRTDK